MTGIEEGFVLVLLRVTYLAEGLLLAEERAVVQERDEGLVLCAISAQEQSFVPSAVHIVQAYVHSFSHMKHAPQHEVHVHKRIDMAQVPLLGVVGGHVIH